VAGVILDSAGNVYGTTTEGGASGFGVVFKVDATGKETVLYSFTGGADGGSPYTGVILDPAGNLYGTTGSGGTGNNGVLFKLSTTGEETVRHNFAWPPSGVIFDAAGNLDGTTQAGGASGLGIVFKVDTTGQETVLHSFTGSLLDGASPIGGVILDHAGNLYGTTSGGGASNLGTVYMLDSTGEETVLYSFAETPDGNFPKAGVVRDPARNLYGTTFFGGPNQGTVFKLAP
jgi:uncharacterized repeat protein (TIGR03803 family)